MCIPSLVLVVGAIFVLVTLIRWFEQITDAVDLGWWNKVTMLIFMPFTVWFFPSRSSTGRSTPVPHHEPVRGFGTIPKTKAAPSTNDTDSEPPLANLAPAQAPPGTPQEFLGMPKIPPPKPRPKPAVDPEKIAKLKQKMKDQGMLE